MGGMGVFLQKISGTSTVFLDCKGQPIMKELGYGEMIEVDEDHIIAMQGIQEHQALFRLVIEERIRWGGVEHAQNFRTREGISESRKDYSPHKFLNTDAPIVRHDCQRMLVNHSYNNTKMRRLPVYFLIDVSESMVGQNRLKRYRMACAPLSRNCAWIHTPLRLSTCQ